MNNLNSILIEGNLVRDALLKNTVAGSTVCNFTIATNRFYSGVNGMEKEVSYFDVEAWSKLAEDCHEHGYKGKGVRVVGRLKQSRWNDIRGQSHSRIFIVAEHVEFRPDFARQDEPRRETLEESA